MVFYHTINADDPAYTKLFSEDEYAGFRERIRDEFFSSGFFKDMCQDMGYEEIIPAYIGYVTMGMYLRWRAHDNGKHSTLEQLADSTADLLMNGLSAMS